MNYQESVAYGKGFSDGYRSGVSDTRVGNLLLGVFVGAFSAMVGLYFIGVPGWLQ